jgi:hypothetical protein
VGVAFVKRKKLPAASARSIKLKVVAESESELGERPKLASAARATIANGRVRKFWLL